MIYIRNCIKSIILGIAFLLGASGLAHGDLTNGLIAHYQFNGNAQDASGNGNDGAVSGGAILTGDRFGNANSAYLFDGIDDSIQVSSNAALDTISSAATITAWVRPDTTGEAIIVGRFRNNSLWDDPIFLQSRSSRLRSITCSDNPNACDDLPDTQAFVVGQWYHVVGVFDGSSNTARLYLNGVEKASATTSYSTLASSLLGLGIGGTFGTPQGPERQFEGAIDDVRIYNRVLSSLEVSQLFQLDRPVITDGLLSHYAFEESTDAVLIDTVSGYNGTQVRNGILVEQPGKVGKAHHLPGNIDGNDADSIPDGGVWVIDQPGFNIGLNSMTVNGWFKAEPSGGVDPPLWGWRGHADTLPDAQPFRINPRGRNDVFWLLSNSSGDIILSRANDSRSQTTPALTLPPSASGTPPFSPIDITSDWHMVTVVLDRSNQKLRIYVDGNLDSTSESASPALAAINSDGLKAPFLIGSVNTECCDDTAIRTWRGFVDEFSIWTRVLSDLEIHELYNSGNGISLDTVPPTSDAGPDQSIRAGDLVLLDGSNSFDDNTISNLLLYDWNFSSLPQGSLAVLSNSDTAMPSFIADVAGTYVVELVVTDEAGLSSTPDEVEVSSDNLAPTAVAGDNQLVIVGDTVTLDGSASNDPESDLLAYSWGIDSAPPSSAVTLNNPNVVITSFTPDVEGIYIISLVVSDFIGSSDPDTLEVTATSAEQLADILITDVDNIVEGLDPDQGEVTNQGNQNAFQNFLSQAIQAIQEGEIDEAIGKLEKAIERTDGCVLRGSPDTKPRDWITDCTAQTETYILLNDALDALIAI